ncbi:Gfo/Idh/MocA family oxidoreductase [bacterium]|nr:Gfo/Idh/MocA family oxidoreductase [bacterium]
MERIKIGQIGIGHAHASGNIEALRGLPELYDIVGVVEEESPDWPSPKAYEGLERMTEQQLFNTPGLQAVAVETSNADLVSTATRCMERGLHIHMDKPSGETMAPFKKLVDGCRARGLALQVAYMYRTNPAINFCSRALREGWLGEVFEVHVVMSRRDGDHYRQFLSRFAGGAMYVFGSHLVDLVVAMLGRPQNVVSFQRATRDDGANDNGLAVLEYPRATATLRTSIAEVDGMKHRRLLLCGTKGTTEVCPLEHPGDRYHLDPLHVRLTLLEDNTEYPAGTHIVNVGVMNGRYEEQLTEFARILRGEIDNPYPYEHELLVHETLLAAAGYTRWGDGQPTG